MSLMTIRTVHRRVGVFDQSTEGVRDEPYTQGSCREIAGCMVHGMPATGTAATVCAPPTWEPPRQAPLAQYNAKRLDYGFYSGAVREASLI